MTLPAFSAAGTGDENTVAWPTHAAGDLGILCVEHSNSGTTIPTPTGWTPMPGTPIDPGATFNVCLSVFYRFATSNAMTAATIAGTVNHRWGVILTYTGVNTGNPIHALTSAYFGPANTAMSAPGLTTLLDDCMIVTVIAWSPDDAGPLGSSPTNAALGSVNERSDSGTITGGGGGIYVFDGTLATHTTIGPSAVTMSSAALGAILVFALTAADKTLPTLGRKSRVVNMGGM